MPVSKQDYDKMLSMIRSFEPGSESSEIVGFAKSLSWDGLVEGMSGRTSLCMTACFAEKDDPALVFGLCEAEGYSRLGGWVEQLICASVMPKCVRHLAAHEDIGGWSGMDGTLLSVWAISEIKKVGNFGRLPRDEAEVGKILVDASLKYGTSDILSSIGFAMDAGRFGKVAFLAENSPELPDWLASLSGGKVEVADKRYGLEWRGLVEPIILSVAHRKENSHRVQSSL